MNGSFLRQVSPELHVLFVLHHVIQNAPSDTWARRLFTISVVMTSGDVGREVDFELFLPFFWVLIGLLHDNLAIFIGFSGDLLIIPLDFYFDVLTRFDILLLILFFLLWLVCILNLLHLEGLGRSNKVPESISFR